jgi:hypothetical protein
MQMRKAITLFQAEHADEAIAIRRNRAVVDALNARRVMPPDDGIPLTTPHDITTARRSFLPWNGGHVLDGRTISMTADTR